MEEPQLKYHISWVVGGTLIGITFLIWLLQFLLTLTVALIPVAMIVGEGTEWVVELVFLFLMRSYFMRGKRMVQRIVALFAESAAELTPILNCLIPILPISTWFQIHSYRADDRSRYQEAYAKWEEATQAERDQEEREYGAALYAAHRQNLQAAEMQQSEELEDA